MLAKLIDSNKESVKIITPKNTEFLFSGTKVWKNEKYYGNKLRLPGMHEDELLIVEYDTEIKKNCIKAVYSTRYRYTKIRFIYADKLSSEGKTPYTIVKKDNICELFDTSTSELLGKIVSDKNLADQIVIANNSRYDNEISHVICHTSPLSTDNDQDKLFSIIESKLGPTQLPDLRQIFETDSFINGKETLVALAKLLEERSFEQHYLERIKFQPGEFLHLVSHYLELLDIIDQKTASGVIKKDSKQNFFQNAITIAIYMNIGLGREKFRNSIEHEEMIIAKVLKLGQKSFFKLTSLAEVDKTAKNKYDTLPDTQKTEPYEIRRGSNKHINYYHKHNGYEDIPEQYKSRANTVIKTLTQQQPGALSMSGEKAAGIIKIVFSQKDYQPKENNYYKLILALENIFETRNAKKGVTLSHSKLTSFFRTLAYAFDTDHFDSENFTNEFNKALLLTLIDINFYKKEQRKNKFFEKYKPLHVTTPKYNAPTAERIEHHRKILKLIEADTNISDPLDIFFDQKE